MNNNLYIAIFLLLVIFCIFAYIQYQNKIKIQKIEEEKNRLKVLKKKQNLKQQINPSLGNPNNTTEDIVIDDPEEIKTGQPIIKKRETKKINKNIRKKSLEEIKKEEDYASDVKRIYQGDINGENEHKRISIDRPLIMIVDDSKSAIFYAERILKKEYDIITAFDGQDALNKMVKNIPDLVITDADMPILDGFGLLLKMKNDIGLASIPVIMATGKIELHAKIGAEKGLQGFLTKPYEADSLLDQVSYLLENS